jgi:hypothetical protein
VDGLDPVDRRLRRHGGALRRELGIARTRALRERTDARAQPDVGSDGEIERDMRANDPDNAAREIDAIPLAAGTKLFFTAEMLKACVDTKPDRQPPADDSRRDAGPLRGYRPRLPTQQRRARARARGDHADEAWAEGEGPRRLARGASAAPGAKLKPSEVCTGFGKKCQEYRCGGMLGDYHYVDSAHEYLDALPAPQVRYLEASQKPEDIEERFTKFRTMHVGGGARPAEPRAPPRADAARRVEADAGRRR